MARIDRLARRDAGASPALISHVRDLARPLNGPEDLDPLMDLIGDSRYVLLGEASHGTSEYYTWRAAITRRLIAEKGFSFLAVEGDWPDCYRVDRYVKGRGEAGASARGMLRGFERWPTWMWANEEVADLAEWLRSRNEGLADDRRVGFYGLDVYSLWDSLHAILDYLHAHDPAALPSAWRAFRCFEPYGEDVRDYARASRFVSNSCEDEVVALLGEMRRRGAEA
jgi:erythromycin esterase-like protein